VDLNARTRFDMGDWGTFRQNLQITNPISYRTNGGVSTVGREGAPRYRGILQNAWLMGDWEFAWNINYIHGTQSVSFREWLALARTDNRTPAQDATMAARAADPWSLPSWVTHDLQVSYNAPWNAKVTFGVQNLGDKDPVVDPRDPTGRGFRFALYDGYGR